MISITFLLLLLYIKHSSFRFKRPNSFRGGIDEIALNEFVGPELNNQLIAFNFRSTQRTNAVLARSILGVRIDTSSGAGIQ